MGLIVSTQLTVPYLLPEDLLVIPVTELSADSRSKLDARDDDFAITRPKSRTASSVIDADSADLLQRFRSARTIIDAVVDFSRARSADPHAVLEGVFPVLRRLIAANLLLPADNTLAKAVVASYEVGDRIGQFEIVRQISLVFDVELYQAIAPDGTPCLIKLARAEGGSRILRSLAREASVLERLAGLSVPRLLDRGAIDGLPYLAVEWCDGIAPTMAAAEFRPVGGPVDRVALRTLLRAIASAYEQLHERGIAHGDVHGANVLVGRDGNVTLIDFGQAYDLHETTHNGVARGGVLPHYDPEMAAALKAGHSGPPATALSEQYGVGTLLYSVATGQTYLELAVRRDAALEQILTEAPVPFELRGCEGWPELEAIIGRMLAKDSAHRFGSMADVVDALDRLDVEDSRERSSDLTGRPVVRGPSVAARELLDRLSLGGSLFQSGLPVGPRCSVNNGAAGIAHAWYRIALFREDPGALATASAWGRRALAWTTSHEAYFLDDKTVTPSNVGRNGLFHSISGVHCVKTLIAHAAGDPAEARRSVDAFEEASRRRSDKWDLTLGRAGLLLGAALQFESDPSVRPAARRIGARHAAALAKYLAAAGTIKSSHTIDALGIAHGWAGALYALLRWSAATGEAPSQVVLDRLDELSAHAERGGRGISWPRFRGRMDAGLQPTWCNGDTGFVFLWLLAGEVLNDPRYALLAEHSAWNVADRAPDRMVDLCCGSAGRAYGFLALYRHTSEGLWLCRAKRFAEHAARAIDPDATEAHRLFKGALGVALLITELEDPARARMPLFESEGWRWPHASR